MFSRVCGVFLARRHGAPETATSNGVEEESSEEVYHDAARHFLDVQISTSDLLDRNVAQSFSVGSVVLPVTFALLNLGTTEVPPVAFWSIGFALASYLGLLLCAAKASRIRSLEYRPNTSTLREHSATISKTVLRQWVANEYEASTRQNAMVIGEKGQVGRHRVTRPPSGSVRSIRRGHHRVVTVTSHLWAAARYWECGR